MGLYFSQRDRERMAQRDDDWARHERLRRDDRPGNGGSYQDRNRFGEHRGFVDKAGDEVKSWFGDDAAERRRDFDERIEEREEDSRRGRDTLHQRPREIMTRDVATVHPDEPVERAAKLMRECDCGSLPVVNHTGRLIGMITDRDITVRLVARGRDVRNACVEDAMTKKAYACHEQDDIEDCMEGMARHQVRRMPVVDDRERVVGILSQADLAQFIGRSRRPGERFAVVDVLTAVSEPNSRGHR